MRTLTALAVVCIASVSALSTEQIDLQSEFVMWASQHNKFYKTVEEYEMRFFNWIKTHLAIEEVNGKDGETVVLGHNKFSDWSDAEYTNFLSYRPKDTYRTQEPTLLDTSSLPDSINWVEKGAVNEVQDQGNCGSCWAFSAVAQMEGQHFVQSGELLKLSEQQCVDCDTDSHGCSGGWQDNCMWYVFDNGGMSLESDYPYEAMTDLCYAEFGGASDFFVQTVRSVPGRSEAQLLAALAKGPVSVTVDADSLQFRQYTSGVITSDDCGTALDHAITAVGYGTDEDGQDYYLVRNSWGKAWGDNGYLKIGRNGDGYGICGIQEISVWAVTN